jgi:Bacterial Ig-like domain (group 3)/MBG domain (YGX type)
VYGDAEPSPLTTGNGEAQTPGHGFVTADNVTAIYSRAPGDTVAGSPYHITASLSANAGALANYIITNAGADFTIGLRPATWTTNPAGKVYGDAEPSPLTTGSAVPAGVGTGFLAGDNVTATYSRAPGNSVAGSPYHITATLSANAGALANYTITNAGADFTIGLRPATWTTNPNSKVFGAPDPSPLTTGSGSGFVDPVTAAYSRTIGEGVASYPITAALSGAPGVLDNYTVTNAGASFTITRAATTTAITHDDPDPSVLNSAYLVNWSVTVTSPGSGTPTGTVMVSDGSVSCSAAVATGGCSLTSTTLGTKSLSATYSGDGNFTGSAGSASHNVQYAFTGFYAPVDNSPVVNKANAGQAIPVKWRLTDTNGAGISDPSSFTSLTAYTVPCNAWASLPTDPQLLDQVSTSGLLYQGNGNWQYNWKTPKNYANTCMVARVTLADGTTHEFNVSFK